MNNPKNLAAISDACALLTPEQATQLGAGSTPKSEISEYGESQCTWSNDNFAANVAINTKRGGPAKIQEGATVADNFAPTAVAGYPAARVDAQSILCLVEVGVADTQSVEIHYFKHSGKAPEMQDPCGYAEKIAGEVLKNIPAA